MVPRGEARRVVALLAAVGCVLLAACNPLPVDPTGFDDVDAASARYTGPDGAWFEVSVSGAEDYVVLLLGAIRAANVTGPTVRPCMGAGDAVVDCLAPPGSIQTPTQLDVPGDGSAYQRLMTLWPDEVAEVWIVCIDTTTNELHCPDGMRAKLRTVDETGALVGDLAHVPVG
jgi:hypothetical protein